MALAGDHFPEQGVTEMDGPHAAAPVSLAALLNHLEQSCLTRCRQLHCLWRRIIPESFMVWSKKHKKTLLGAAKEAQEGGSEIRCLGQGRGQTAQGRRHLRLLTRPVDPAGCLFPAAPRGPHSCPSSKSLRNRGKEALPKVTPGKSGSPTPTSVSVHPCRPYAGFSGQKVCGGK